MTAKTRFAIPVPCGTGALGASACADALRPEVTETTRWLGGPVADERLVRVKEALHLFNWIYFNPAGPTTCDLVLVGVPERDEALLIGTMAHPLVSWVAAFGLLPAAAALDRTALQRILAELFRRNGSEEHALLGGLPSSVDPCRGESPLTPARARDVFLPAVEASLVASGDDLRTTCVLLERHLVDPWAESRAAFESTFRQLRGAIETVNDPDAPEARRRTAHEQLDVAAKPSTWSRSLLHRWWSLVSDPARIFAVQADFSAAWQGAVAFRQGML